MKTAGRSAYQSYRVLREAQREPGDLPTPEWERLPDTLQRAWEYTACAINKQMETANCLLSNSLDRSSVAA